MAQEKGNLSINSENFLPIIKKWLYTDKDIFIRELASNACDAVTKLQKLMQMGEADNVPADEKFAINIVLDTAEQTLKIIDNGIGMTHEEIKKYINQIAFSGASDFLAAYADKMDSESEIIGHFGLGFYSAFMVADKVEIDTLSHQEGAASAKWVCQGGIDFEMEDGTKESRGTCITLHLGDDGAEFLEEGILYKALSKYCAFMPVAIYLDIVKPEEKKEDIIEDIIDDIIDDIKEEDIAEEKDDIEEKKEELKPLNDINPLWLKQPKDCTDEDYKSFYHKVFHDMNDPLFWIHLNMDYPFRLKGILYFPKLVEQMDVTDGEIKLYSNQVYIADNIKEVVPEFLLLLKGMIDCPDMPLNVSRSALQNDGYAGQMSSYITKKVADKLNQLFKNERETYEGFWNNISLFIKYGCMKEEKLFDKIKDSLLLKTTEGVFKTVPEYLESNKENHENKIFFVSDETQQAQYIRLFKEQGLEAAIMTAPIDKPFISFLEYKNSGVKIQRIDTDLKDTLQIKEDELSEDDKKAFDAVTEEVQTLFRNLLGQEKLKVELQALKTGNVSAVMLLSEDSRRMMEMMEVYAQNDAMKSMFANAAPDETLVLNKSNNLVQALLRLKDAGNKADVIDIICHQIYDLAQMSHKSLSSDEMTKFIDRSNLILEKLAEQ